MRAFVALLKAQVLILARDPGYWLSTLAIAVISIFVFGYLFTGALEDFPLGVVDGDGSAASERVVQALRDAEGIDLSEGPEDEELDSLRDGKRWAVLVVPEGFEEGIAAGGTKVQVYYNPTNLASATASRSAVQSIIAGINRSLAGGEPLVSVQEQSVSARHLRVIDFIIPGMVGLTIMFGGVGAGVFLVAWRQQGILRRLGVTPLRPWVLIASQMLSLLALSVVSITIVLFLGWLLFDVSVQGSLLTLAVVVLAGALTMLGVGYFIGSQVRTTVAASAIVNLVTLPMIFLGGSYFPTDSAPAFVAPLVRIAPLTHLNNALRAVINDGDGLRAISVPLAVLAAWIVGTIALSSRVFRWE